MGLGWDAGLFVECPALGDKGRDHASARGFVSIPAREIYGGNIQLLSDSTKGRRGGNACGDGR